jgi:hypothetical protein
MRSKFLIIVILLAAISCSGPYDKNPLIIPPNLNEMPDLTKTDNEDQQEKSSEEEINEIRDLLLN